MFEFTLKENVFVHQLINPPTRTRKNDINLELINSAGDLKLYKAKSNFVSEYLLSIDNPLKIGFTSSEQFIINQEIQNLILAFNLCLSKSCLTRRNIEFRDSQIDMINPQTRTYTKKSGKSVEIFINDFFSVRDTASISVGYKEDIDEYSILNVFNELQITKRFNINIASLTLHNLSKALTEYESAMNDIDLINKFKHIFNAIEIAINYDGIKRESDEFDNEVEKLTSIFKSNIRSWRQDYNRFKHYDTNKRDRDTYLKSKELIQSYLSDLRDCCKTILLFRL